MLPLFLVVLSSNVVHLTGSATSVVQCDPANHICEGRCPDLPPGAKLPVGEKQTGLCLKDAASKACVCWMRSHPSEQHLQTVFKCTAVVNDTEKEVMCLPPPNCFLPDDDPGCLIIPHCTCIRHLPGSVFGNWHPAVALILRGNIAVSSMGEEKIQGDIREFSLKHLLFLLAFVIAPLLCWCLLTFFHEGKCRKKRRTPETEPMSTVRCEEPEEPQQGPCAPVPLPSAPKFESPPPYRETADSSESRLLAVVECGPPPSYEDAVRDQCQRIQEPESD